MNPVGLNFGWVRKKEGHFGHMHRNWNEQIMCEGQQISELMWRARLEEEAAQGQELWVRKNF